jgi:hypothetical protein
VTDSASWNPPRPSKAPHPCRLAQYTRPPRPKETPLHTILRRTLTSVAALGLAAGALTAGATTASATDRVNNCGSSYTYLHSYPIQNTSSLTSRGQTVGYIDLYWSNARGRNCAIARPNNGVPHPAHIDVQIWTTDFSKAVSDGWGTTNYTKYAGPVSIVSPSCVSVQGGFEYNDGEYEVAWAKATNVYC